MSKITIIEGNSDDKDQVRNFMVKGEPGNDGVSPTVETSKTGDTATIVITDGEGEHEFELKDGVSPTVSTSKTGKVTTVTITDADGPHTATINDGGDGATLNIIDNETLSDITSQTYSGRIIDEKISNIFIPEVVTITGTWDGGSDIIFDLPTGYTSSNFTVLNVYLGANHSLIYSTSDGLIFTKDWLVNSSNKLVVDLISTSSFPSSLSKTVYAELLKLS